MIRSASTQATRATADLLEGARMWRTWKIMALYDIRQRYRRSILGPLWVTVSTAIMCSGLGFVFGTLFAVRIDSYLPYVSISLILWAWLGANINEACAVFSGADSLIRQLRMPFSFYFYRMNLRNLVVLAHNMLVYVFVALYFQMDLSTNFLWVLATFPLLVVNCFWMTVVIGIFATRFRDVPMIVTNVFQLFFFITPVMWRAEQLNGPVAKWFLMLNPFNHMLEVLRAPLLGEAPPVISLVFTAGFALAGCAAAFALFVRTRKRIVFWL